MARIKRPHNVSDEGAATIYLADLLRSWGQSPVRDGKFRLPVSSVKDKYIYFNYVFHEDEWICNHIAEIGTGQKSMLEIVDIAR